MYTESDSRLHGLSSCLEELGKFEQEVQKFDGWMNDAENQLRVIQRTGGDLQNLASQTEQHKVCVHVSKFGNFLLSNVAEQFHLLCFLKRYI